MNVHIQNIGILKDAEICLDGLSVITGYNDSGKSTVGKALYSLYHGINVYQDKILDDSVDYVMGALKRYAIDSKLKVREGLRQWFIETMDRPDEEIADQRMKLVYNLLLEVHELGTRYHNQVGVQDTADLAKRLETVQDPVFKFKVKTDVILQTFKTEFDGKIRNAYTRKTGKMRVYDGETDCNVLQITNSTVKFPNMFDGEFYFKDVVFIDTPMILSDFFDILMDLRKSKTKQGHRVDLVEKLINENSRNRNNIIDDTLAKERLEAIDKMIGKVLAGDVALEEGHLLYKIKGQSFGAGSLASGLKSYVIIRRLLDNGYLRENSLLIIDEPEVHLHPQWQLYFAELLVLMAKQLDLRMILTTHSPYFLQALDVFSKKHGFHQKTHFYLAKREADGAVIENIDGKLDETYNMLAEPIIRLRELYEEQLETGT